MRGIADVIDALDLAVGSAAGVLGEEAVADTAALAREARQGRGYLGGTLVLALAGGTGSGKSSLLNALAGEEVASVSSLRPHTDEPLAWIDAAAEPGLGDLLDRLVVDRRVTQDRFPGLAIIDLPDQDSIVSGHRLTTEHLLSLVDAVAWVLDPEKYRDRSLHVRYLAPLAAFYGEQFVFVLNQVDRLGSHVPEVVADLAAALRVDGIAAPQIFTTAANPPDGSPQGMEPLEGYLRDRLDAKRVAVGKLLGDVRRAAAEIADRAGLRHGASIGFAERWEGARNATVAELLVASARTDDALCRLEDFVAAVSVEVGGVPGRRIRDEVSRDVVEQAVTAAAAARPAPATEPRRRFRRKRRDGPPDVAAMHDEIDRRIGQPLRSLLWDRAALGAILAGVEIAVAGAEARLRS